MCTLSTSSDILESGRLSNVRSLRIHIEVSQGQSPSLNWILWFECSEHPKMILYNAFRI